MPDKRNRQQQARRHRWPLWSAAFEELRPLSPFVTTKSDNSTEKPPALQKNHDELAGFVDDGETQASQFGDEAEERVATGDVRVKQESQKAHDGAAILDMNDAFGMPKRRLEIAEVPRSRTYTYNDETEGCYSCYKCIGHVCLCDLYSDGCATAQAHGANSDGVVKSERSARSEPPTLPVCPTCPRGFLVEGACSFCEFAGRGRGRSFSDSE